MMDVDIIEPFLVLNIIFVLKLFEKSKGVYVLKELFILTNCVDKLTAFVHDAYPYVLIFDFSEIFICDAEGRKKGKRK